MHSNPPPREPVANVTNVRRWEAECAGKDRYPSESAAWAVLAHIKREGSAHRACWLEAYQCRSCGEWHLGNV